MQRSAIPHNMHVLVHLCVTLFSRLLLNPTVDRVPSASNQTSFRCIFSQVSLRHLGHWRKARFLGPGCNSPETLFNFEGQRMTVADYFNVKARTLYRNAIPGGRLKFPALPAINLGTKTKPIYVPPELVVIPGGQVRSNVCTGDMTSQMIR